MKKILFTCIVSTLFLLLPVVHAQTELPDPGTTPDSFFYFLDVAMDNLALAMTSNTDVKIEKQLEIAEERLAEARAMAVKNNLEAMQRAESEHANMFAKLKEEIKNVKGADSVEKLRKELEVERRVEKHGDKVEDVKDELRVKIEVEGALTQEQWDLIKSILDSLEGHAGEVEVEVEIEKGRTRISVEQETGRSGLEVEIEIENELGITEERRNDALEEIADVHEDLSEILAEAGEEGVTLPENLLEKINDLLARAQAAFDAGNFREAEDLADQADDLLDELEDVLEIVEEDLEREEEAALEAQLMTIFEQINAELSNPLEGFVVLSENIDAEGDTLSSTTEAQKDEAVDLGLLQEKLLAGLSGWESRNVVLNGDSLDITFEKDYPVVTIVGADYAPSSSVTISVTVEEGAFTTINYDIDITLEETE